MVIIYLAIGIILLRVVYKATLTPQDNDFEFENIEKYSWITLNPTLKILLVIAGLFLIISGIASMF